MDTPFTVIAELETIREHKSQLQERESQLTKPLLTNWALMPEIYAWFKDILGRKEPEPFVDSPTQRRKIIFIYLYLYAPAVLVGEKIPSGLRETMARAIQLKDVTFISHNINHVVFHYQNYKDFRSEMNDIYQEITQRLVLSGQLAEGY